MQFVEYHNQLDVQGRKACAFVAEQRRAQEQEHQRHNFYVCRLFYSFSASVCMFVCLYVCMSVCLCVCRYVGINICRYLCMQVCMYLCV